MRGILFTVEMLGVWLGTIALCQRKAEAHPAPEGHGSGWVLLGSFAGFAAAAVLAWPFIQINDWLASF